MTKKQTDQEQLDKVGSIAKALMRFGLPPGLATDKIEREMRNKRYRITTTLQHDCVDHPSMAPIFEKELEEVRKSEKIVEEWISNGKKPEIDDISVAVDVDALVKKADELYGKKIFVAASNWYRQAANRGSTHAHNNLGIMYATGRGVCQSDTEAISWYRKAAKQGNKTAIDNLKKLGITEYD